MKHLDVYIIHILPTFIFVNCLHFFLLQIQLNINSHGYAKGHPAFTCPLLLCDLHGATTEIKSGKYNKANLLLLSRIILHCKDWITNSENIHFQHLQLQVPQTDVL